MARYWFLRSEGWTRERVARLVYGGNIHNVIPVYAEEWLDNFVKSKLVDGELKNSVSYSDCHHFVVSDERLLEGLQLQIVLKPVDTQAASR